MHLIELKNIDFSYGQQQVLKDLSLAVDSGKLTCLLGGSGSGKTTILRLIAGLEVPGGGKVLIADKPVSDAGTIIVPPQKRGIGFIFQDLALWPHLTVFQNIAFGLKAQGIPDIESKVIQMLQFFGIEKLTAKYPHELSGGQQQLVAISRALVLKPRILLMDEPLTGLDVKLKHRIIDHIKALKNEFEVTIVYVTHDHHEAFAIADQITVLNRGRVEVSARADALKKSENEYVKYFLEY